MHLVNVLPSNLSLNRFRTEHNRTRTKPYQGRVECDMVR